MTNRINNNSSDLPAYALPDVENKNIQDPNEFNVVNALGALLKGTASGAVGVPGDIERLGTDISSATQQAITGKEQTKQQKNIQKELQFLPTTEDVSDALGNKQENKYNKIAKNLGENLGSELALLAGGVLAGAGAVPVTSGLVLRKILKRVLPQGVLHTAVDTASDYAELPSWIRGAGHLLASALGDAGVRRLNKYNLSKDAKKLYKAGTTQEAKLKIAEQIKNNVFKEYDKIADKTFLKDKEVRRLFNNPKIDKAIQNVTADPSIAELGNSVQKRLSFLVPGSTIKDLTDIQKTLNQRMTQLNLGKDISLNNLKNTLKEQIDNISFRKRPTLKKAFDNTNNINVWFEDTKKINDAFSKLGYSNENPIIEALKRVTGFPYVQKQLKKSRLNRKLSKKLAEQIKDDPFINADIGSFMENILENKGKNAFYLKKFKDEINNIDLESDKKKKYYGIKLRDYND